MPGPGMDDYLQGTRNRRFAEYLLAARERFLKGEAATVREVKAVYARAAEAVREDIARLPTGSLRRGYLEALERQLQRRASELRAGLLRATERGVQLSIATATGAGRQLTTDLLGRLFDAGDVRAMFADVNERALLAVMSRTRHDGLRLSDRIWRIGEHWRQAVARVVEDAVLRGEDPRRTAQRVEQYLKPGVGTMLKAETRQRLKVPKDVTMEGLRLAVTEFHHAHHEATILTGRAIPSYRGIFWRLSNAHVVPDVCDDLANHGGNGFWPAGQEPTKPHPWCRCVAIYSLEDTDTFIERLRQWVADPLSQPDLEAWYHENARRFLRRTGQTATTSAPSEPTTTGWDAVWRDTAHRAALFRALAEAVRSRDVTQIARAARPIDEAVVRALEQMGLPRGPIAGLEITDAGMSGSYGVKAPDCRIMLRADYVAAAGEGRELAEKVLRTWVHESIHARQAFASRWLDEYADYPGYEEGLVEGLARIVVDRMGIQTGADTRGIPWHASTVYEPYVRALQGIAMGLGIDYEQMLRRLWQAPLGNVRAALELAIEQAVGISMGEWPPQTVAALRDSMKAWFGRDAMRRALPRVQSITETVAEILREVKRGGTAQ